MNIIDASLRFTKVAIFTWCDINQAWFHTDTMDGDKFVAAYGDNGADAHDIQWRVIND